MNSGAGARLVDGEYEGRNALPWPLTMRTVTAACRTPSPAGKSSGPEGTEPGPVSGSDRRATGRGWGGGSSHLPTKAEMASGGRQVGVAMSQHQPPTPVLDLWTEALKALCSLPHRLEGAGGGAPLWPSASHHMCWGTLHSPAVSPSCPAQRVGLPEIVRIPSLGRHKQCQPPPHKVPMTNPLIPPHSH